MKSIKSIGAVLLVGMALFSGVDGLCAEVCNRVVAVVNDEVITLYELNKKIKEVTGLAPLDLRQESEDAFLDARRKILNLLIDEKISDNKSKELGIVVTQTEVDRAVERIKEGNQWTHEDLLYRLEMQGIDYEEYLKIIKNNIERSKLINLEIKSKIIVREEMIQQYYEEHLDQFSSDEAVHVAGIFLIGENPGDEQEMKGLTATGRHILAELEKGGDFGALAREYSNGPTAPEGGDLGVFKISQLEPAMRDILQGIPKGGVSELIPRRNGIQILKVVDRDEGKKKTLDEVRGAIHDILYQNEVDKRYSSWIKELRETSYTKIIF